jgi:peptidoglycan/LPS O-acetylase OafA/YrhL
MSKKKKAKNSDYRYLQRHYDEQREEREREVRKAEKAKRRFMIILAVLLIVGSLICAGVGYAKQLDWMSPIYLGLSAIGMILIYFYYKEERPKYATTALVVGIVILIVVFMQMNALGWLKYLGFNF